MITVISSTPTSAILATPSSAGSFYARSSQAADTGNLQATGPVTGTPTSETKALTGKAEILFSSAFSALTFAVLSAAQTGTVFVFSGITGVAGNGRIIVTTQPADNDTLIIGLTGLTRAYRFKNTLAAANDVKIGADASETADNLKRAINLDATAGTNYHASTAVNEYLSATVSGTIVTITDRIPCLRQLGWSISQGVGATLSLQAPIGGEDGTLLAQLSPSTTLAANPISLDDEALTLDLMPALLDFYSDWMRVAGKRSSLYVSAENVSSAIVASYQVATNTSYPLAGSASIASLDNNSQVVNIPEAAEYLRFRFNNTNSTPVSVNAKLVSG